MTVVTDIVFDLGHVLIDFQYDGILALLTRHGVRSSSMDDLLAQMRIHAYETGRMTDEEFFDTLNGLLAVPSTPETLRRAWVDMFTPIPEMLDLARRLARRHGVYVLSNASPLHWEHLRQGYGLDAIGHGQLASFQAGVRKPDPAIYRAAEQRFCLTPASTVFVDDLADNTEGARACGWHAIHHRSPAETRAALHALGVAGDQE